MKNVTKVITYGSLGLLLLLIAGLVSIISPNKEPKVTIGRVAFQVEIANDPAKWRLGLIGHAPLTPGQGMLFIFPVQGNQTFWMKDMTFPIDILWINGDKIVGFADNAQPDQGQTLYQSPGAVDRVLEIGAGERMRLQITTGAPVTVE